MRPSVRALLLRAVLFGVCAILGLLTLFPFTPFSAGLYSAVSLSYVVVFFLVSVLFVRIKRQRPAPASHAQSGSLSPAVWRFWALLTMLWFGSLAAFIIYPALASGVYRFSEDMIWETSFSGMPGYMRTSAAGIFMFFTLFFSCFIYYPLTFYLLAIYLYRSIQPTAARHLRRTLAMAGIAITPMIFYRLVDAMIVWLVD